MRAFHIWFGKSVRYKDEGKEEGVSYLSGG
jgi:hypothetical protein